MRPCRELAMDSINAEISKSVIRKTILNYRRLLDSVEFDRRNEMLGKRLLNHLKKEQPKTIHTFLPIKRNYEPDVLSLIPTLTTNYNVIVSKVDFQSKSMAHFHFQLDTILKENDLGIPEPMDAKPASFEQVDLVLVPLVSADKIGNRIGYGGGYYDRLLNNTKVSKVGLSLSPLLDQMVQLSDWDIKLDIVLTPFENDTFATK